MGGWRRFIPSPGSAYTYVGRGLNPHLGFLAGWAMLLDYLLVPVICTVYTAITIQRVVPGVPYWIWCALIAVLITGVNLWGIRATATANLLMMIAALAVICPSSAWPSAGCWCGRDGMGCSPPNHLQPADLSLEKPGRRYRPGRADLWRL